jgi:hypothetical protein
MNNLATLTIVLAIAALGSTAGNAQNAEPRSLSETTPVYEKIVQSQRGAIVGGSIAEATGRDSTAHAGSGNAILTRRGARDINQNQRGAVAGLSRASARGRNSSATAHTGNLLQEYRN